MSTDEKAPVPTRVVRCPRCRKSTRYDPSNEYRPFCSARCKDEDIIAWAEQGYRIPGPAATDEDEDGEGGGKPPPPQDEDE